MVSPLFLPFLGSLCLSIAVFHSCEQFHNPRNIAAPEKHRNFKFLLFVTLYIFDLMHIHSLVNEFLFLFYFETQWLNLGFLFLTDLKRMQWTDGERDDGGKKSSNLQDIKLKLWLWEWYRIEQNYTETEKCRLFLWSFQSLQYWKVSCSTWTHEYVITWGHEQRSS